MDVRQGPPLLDVVVARIIRKLKHFFGLLQPFTILPFYSYGCDKTVVIFGRVIEKLDIGSPQKEDRWWRNLMNMLRVFLRARAEKVSLTVTINGQSVPIVTDDIGYYQAEVYLLEKLEQPGWIDVDFVLDSIRGYRQISIQRGAVFNIPSAAWSSTGIISDIDDTIVESYATDLLMSARMTFVHNYTTRLAIAGMAELYNYIVQLTSVLTPVFYVTSSSWSLYNLLGDFLKLQGFPRGPLLMQKIGMTNNKLIRKGHNHKTQEIENVLRVTKDQRFFLFGDNGQADREIYFDIATRYPERIAAVCIRVARAKAKPFSTDYERLGVAYFEFDDGYSLQQKMIAEGILPGPLGEKLHAG